MYPTTNPTIAALESENNTDIDAKNIINKLNFCDVSLNLLNSTPIQKTIKARYA